MIEISMKDVEVCYPIHQSKSLKDFFAKKEAVPALKKINLHIKQGERVGLIGLNGAGKSTMLKVMAQIYRPTQGVCVTRGNICPLFEFATGFEMDLTGWHNIRIRGMLLGMSRKEVEEKAKEIAAFTELGDFLNYPVRTYSSGMFVRLAFAVSTSVEPEILLLDEVMGAGDAAFAAKAQARINQFIDKGQIMIFSSHSFDLVEKFCERSIWLHKGVIMADGPTPAVWKEYTKFANNKCAVA